ncbi:DUF2079 domain-containing protein [Crocinitomix catalasitica]|uniref:DUF2079 domain-containing protein n=1 Tax=Crocinitomix catalasitica TaxID=184607 RepID=UPI000481BC5F|nr:DUF2079 domain-containing protein [Crocinitomix catalasitica]
MEILKKHKYFVLTLVFFGVLYALISLVNHYFFRTYALDLGAYNNALFDYVHFQLNDSTVFKETSENLLADHFDIYLILFAPLSLIFGTYTLLIVQIVFLLFGGAGVYAYFKSSEKTAPIALMAAVFFYSFFGVFGAVANDYHSNVIAASLIPWFFYLVRYKKILASSFLLLLLILSKENISLWLVFVCLGLGIEYRKDVYRRNYLLIASVFSGICFVIITSVLMPALANNNQYPHFHYSYLGNSSSEALIHLITHPVESISMLFTNHNNSLGGDFVKMELHVLLLFSGLLFLIKKPHYLLMLVPIYFQKLFHDNYSMWGIGGQYSIEFAPILAIGIFMVVAEFKKQNLIKPIGVIIVCLAIGSTFRTMDNTVYFTNKSQIRFYQKSHYQRDYNVAEVHQELSKIPADAVVSAQSSFLPHLSLRDNIYQFPMIKDAEYIIYSEMENTYPLKDEEFIALTNKLKDASEWQVLYDAEVIILKRGIN